MTRYTEICDFGVVNVLAKSLKLSFKDAASYSVMVGMGESYLSAYVLALGFSAASSGLITTVPVVVGSCIQLSFLWIYRHLKSYRNWVIMCARAQATCLLMLASLPYFFNDQLLPIYLAATFYWACGFSAGPAWNAWMGALVPRQQRVSFFARRSRTAETFTYIGLFVGGISLQIADEWQLSKYCFTLLFILAAMARLMSSFFISKQLDQPKEKIEETFEPKITFTQELKKPKVLFLFLYLFVLQTAVYISGPFYTPYMLKDLNLNYALYMFLTSATFLSRIIFYPFIQKLADKKGPLRLLIAGTFLICLSPFLWTLSKNYFYLICLQVLSGVAWGMQELGLFLLLLDRFSTRVRSNVLSVVNFLSATGMLIGSFVGSRLISQNPPDTTSFYFLFTVSSLCRSFAFLLTPLLDDVPKHRRFQLFWRIVGLRPNLGAIVRPILYTQKQKKDSNKL